MELVLPKNYVVLDCLDEVVGEGYWTQIGHAEWTWTFTRADCATMTKVLGAGSSIASAVAYFFPAAAPYAGAVASVLGYSATIFQTGTRYNGLRIYFHTMWWGRTPRWVGYI